MTTVDWSGVRDRVLELGERPGAAEVFGARGHGWVLEEPLSRAQLDEVETQTGVTLPADYRSFLLDVGAGGAGPSYGIFVLRRTPDGWRWFDDARTAVDHALIGREFPNPLHDSAEALRAALDADHPDEHPGQYPDPDSEAKKNAKRAWGARRRQLAQDLKTTGALPLCHHGGGSRAWLAVTGAERGTMWCDPEGSGVSLVPDHLDADPERSRIGFGRFYLSWLEEATRIVSMPA
ncbi:hypothetical protein BCL76_10134 [Streptomyces sp. CG 926]|uniref:SMI1/KNR4 family protein n=1 Tax=Streptomyces sp. CG 926 TaxID=1882405 RepID=UPI000D7A7534|nr:SMI1/KNR4 family protein [Streptomyces sp. CG 926]PWK74306.1 hypothetical protein BCL76_10134 [Streptomyces sp. CG 926]